MRGLNVAGQGQTSVFGLTVAPKNRWPTRYCRVSPGQDSRGGRPHVGIDARILLTLVNTSELIYDWNQMDAARLRPAGPVLLNDETLRDGLQSPSVRDPSIAEKIQILHLMEALGINSLDLGSAGRGTARASRIARRWPTRSSATK